MQKINLYRFIRPDGGVTVSPVMPDSEYTELFRLVADDGMTLANGETVTPCTDTDKPEAWTEIDDPAELNRQYTETDEPIEHTEDE